MNYKNEDLFAKELDELAQIQCQTNTEGREQASKKSKEELEQERFNSLMDSYLELRRKRRIEIQKNVQQGQSNPRQKATEEKGTKEEKHESPLNWLFAVN